MASAAALLGIRFSRLMVVGQAPNANGRTFWSCRCDCGAACVVRSDHLASGHSASCGCAGPSRPPNLVGRRFGRMTVVQGAPSVGTRSMWLCRCDCGTEKAVIGRNLLRGKTLSCGCLRRETSRVLIRKLHPGQGRPAKRERNSWQAMLRRCSKASHNTFPLYGGRGIRVCERWHTFENFLADMGPRPPGTSLDRVNNDGNYEPSNCRWATAKQQMNNRRPSSQWKNRKARVA